ncbi:hypothetical protein EaACW_1115 [Erwinia amylovora ACW56400]|uniref:Uncharacterized protein n=2 Tax=Erwinia amylovora TaxID=552 RepID=A0A831A252_ERWAM|nr:hypothetical protein EaACW_1115 [Erwinia amylovora ACW56400]RUT17802.1 hypothetical protein BEI72_05555 [Erwinia amylovora]CBA20055.1 hypothetical protein predicted by Glimmer/Critica [Erwinia amylovora CFBP1430]CCO77959.1 hypothetical protein BN432_1139 [Erwinia amylovora Ea356]CCO81746.1 hypothetical protein BN433_1153 [Erwinia amylovora Ea266]CCO89333.1 hypothetical protein BN435_1139 [Erwinia amylovora 01SFR-BO]CCO93084.1 hypothetical protein BN437_1132 [Erwinia amylovora NBRC 12687 = 
MFSPRRCASTSAPPENSMIAPANAPNVIPVVTDPSPRQRSPAGYYQPECRCHRDQQANHQQSNKRMHFGFNHQQQYRYAAYGSA